MATESIFVQMENVKTLERAALVCRQRGREATAYTLLRVSREIHTEIRQHHGLRAVVSEAGAGEGES